MENIKKSFGHAMKKFRNKEQLSQEKLAEITGLHRTYISEIERGERNLSLENIVKISKGLNITTSNLFIEIEKEQNSESE